jgi:hypothetical protein
MVRIGEGSLARELDEASRPAWAGSDQPSGDGSSFEKKAPARWRRRRLLGHTSSRLLDCHGAMILMKEWQHHHQEVHRGQTTTKHQAANKQCHNLPRSRQEVSKANWCEMSSFFFVQARRQTRTKEFKPDMCVSGALVDLSS